MEIITKCFVHVFICILIIVLRMRENNKKSTIAKETKLFPLGFEPRTFRVLGERDNHYTTETYAATQF